MKLELELLGEDEDIQALKSDVDEMQQMLEGYLSFARGEGNEAPRVVNLVELLTDAVTNARRDGSEVMLAAPRELHVPVRRDAFRRCPHRQRHALWRPCLGGRDGRARLGRDPGGR